MSESTSIDRLSIEITSNSTSAATSIDALAISLGNLKQNGSVSVAVKNLNNLSSALRQFTNTSAVARTVGILAEAMGKMKEVGSIATVGNSVKKLGESLRSLDGVNVDDVAPKIRAIADAVRPLSEVKAGGLNTMINGLRKLDEVTDKLDDGTISRFANRINQLNNVLGPLSTKMTTIQVGLRGLNTKSKTAGNGVAHLGTKVNTTTLNMASMVTVIQGVVSALMPLVRLLSDSISAAIEWDGIAARFGRGFGSQAQEVYGWAQRLNEELGINTQQFMQYSSTFATMLNGFGVASEDASKMALGYTELTYDIWAGYNDIYKSYSDAADAVRSAIAGEVEPVRRAGFTIVESTLEQTAANYGLNISLEKATEAQKSYLRYLTLVDQAHAQNLVGTYAREMNTAEGVMRTFSQQLKSLAQSFGSLFLPILVKIMPYLQAFVELLIEAIQAVAAFFGITIQGVDWSGYGDALDGIGGSAEGAGDAFNGAANAVNDTNKALKDLKNATVGIDELNVISPQSKSGSSGSNHDPDWGTDGSGVLDDMGIGSLWDESIFAGINDQVDAIKEKFKEWLPVIEAIGIALGGLGFATLLKNIGDALAQMNLLQKAFATVAIVTIEAALVFTFADQYLESGNLLYLVGEALVTAAAGYLLFRAWGPGGALLGLGVSILAQLVALEMNLADGTVNLSSPETWIQGITTALTGAFGGAILTKNTGFFAKEGFVIGLGVTASLVLIAVRMGAIESGEIESDSVEAWILEIGSVISAGLAGKWLGSALYTKGGPMGALIGVTAGLILNLVGTISVKGEDFGNEVSDWVNAAVTAGMSAITGAKLWQIASPYIVPALQGLLSKVGGWLSANGLSSLGSAASKGGWIGAIIAAIIFQIEFLKENWDEVTQAVKGYYETNLKPMFDEIEGYFDDAGEAFGDIAEDLKSLTDKIKEIAKIVGDWLKETGIWDFFANLTENIGGIIFALGSGGIAGAVSALVTTIKGTIQWFTGVVQIVSGIVGLIVGVFDGDLPKIKESWDKLVEGIKNVLGGLYNVTIGPIVEFVKGVIDWFKELYDELVGHSIVPDTVDEIVEWFKSLPGKVWGKISEFITGITDRFSSLGSKLREKFSSAWTTVKNWWNSKGSLSTYTPSIGSIRDKLSSAWSSAKTWWSKSKGTLSTYTPSIGSIKSKLSSAWSSAKTWWSKNKGSLSYTPSIGSIKSKLQSAWNTAKSWWNRNVRLSIPSLSFKVTYDNSGLGTVKKAIVKALDLPGWPKLKFAANGGIFDTGSLIWAGERGAEIVANAGGGKTGVMNVDQMQDAVYEGVYAAVMAAMRAGGGNGGGQAVNVYLDSRQITATVEQRQRERGASIMGSQVYSY
jgi:hypothetical protein